MTRVRDGGNLRSHEETMLRAARWGGVVLGTVVGLVLFLLPGRITWWGAATAVAVGWGAERLGGRRVRRRAAIRREPFPETWQSVLEGKVAFYSALGPEERRRFRDDIRVFLDEKRVTGIGTKLDDQTRVLAAASAVIPVFGFPDWEWDQIREVLIYAKTFDQDYSVGDGPRHRTLGMVGTGALDRMMILSKPDLHRGFDATDDRRNVGVHEFAHLVDKTDGAIDGVPGAGLGPDAVRPWLDLMRRKMQQIRRGDSDIDPYALTNEAEFFAVTSEYFFERPELMQQRHPELYRVLEQVFRQDMAGRGRAMLDAIRGRRRRIGRNARCPCGSGEKFKRCCLDDRSS